ncbi:glycoside hydrolase [Hymenopellis radicata]|nr:glycoside hydrolase [Hymenopellis radicata]
MPSLDRLLSSEQKLNLATSKAPSPRSNTSRRSRLGSELEEHYKTFITEKDFAEIAGAGLNWVRLPVDKWDGEPFLEQVCWKYILKALSWARKYGLRVNLDLHAIPGSRSGYNHSAKGSGQVSFMCGPMGIANGALNYIRIITEFVSQPEYQDVVQRFGIMNEAVHDIIRGITGVGEGKGFYISIHDGFETDMTQWEAFLAGSDRVVLDRHPYTSFSGSAFDDPIATGTGAYAGAACGLSGTFDFNYAGEWSNGYNDCGLFLTGVGGTQTLVLNAARHRYTLKDYFWTWKIGESAVGSLRQGEGQCGGGLLEFDGRYEPYMTGGAGAGTITAAAAGTPFPPAQINGVDVPVTGFLTSTGSVHTLPGPLATGTKLAPTPIPGCAYPDPWNAVDAEIPTECGGADAAASHED